MEIFNVSRLLAMWNRSSGADPRVIAIEPGWYLWEGLPVGPFETRAEALKRAMDADT